MKRARTAAGARSAWHGSLEPQHRPPLWNTTRAAGRARGLWCRQAVRHDLLFPSMKAAGSPKTEGSPSPSAPSLIPERSFQHWVSDISYRKNQNGSLLHSPLRGSAAPRVHFLKGVSLLKVCQKSEGFLLGSARAKTCCWGTLVGTVTWRWCMGCRFWCGGATGHPL